MTTTTVTVGGAWRDAYDLNAGDNSRVEIIDATFVNNVRTSHRYFYQSTLTPGGYRRRKANSYQ